MAEVTNDVAILTTSNLERTNLGSPNAVFPKTASVQSVSSGRSTMSRPRMKNWCDLNDDDDGSDDDQIQSIASVSSLQKAPSVSELSEFSAGGDSFASMTSDRSSKRTGGTPCTSTEPTPNGTPKSKTRAPKAKASRKGGRSDRRGPKGPSQRVDARSWDSGSSNAGSSVERPLRPPAWSKGAAEHESGNCHPCIFYTKVVGCDNGTDCPFCHLDHDSKARHRRHLRRRRGNVSESGSDAGSTESVGSGGARRKKDGRQKQAQFILPASCLQPSAYPPGQPSQFPSPYPPAQPAPYALAQEQRFFGHGASSSHAMPPQVLPSNVMTPSQQASGPTYWFVPFVGDSQSPATGGSS